MVENVHGKQQINRLNFRKTEKQSCLSLKEYWMDGSMHKKRKQKRNKKNIISTEEVVCSSNGPSKTEAFK